MGLQIKRGFSSTYRKVLATSLITLALLIQPLFAVLTPNSARAIDDTNTLDAPSLVSPENDAYVTGDSLTSSWTSVAQASHYIYESWNDAEATSLRSQHATIDTNETATNIPTATFWWRVKAVSALGDESDWSPLWKVTVDNDKPLFDIADGAVKTTPTVTVGITEQHLASAIVDGSSATPAGAAPNYSVSVSGEGSHTIIATDKAGTTSTVTFTIDSIAPSLAIDPFVRNQDGGYFISGTTTDSAAVTVTIGGMSYTLTPENGKWSINIGPLTEGDYSVAVSSTDAAGNSASLTRTLFARTPTAPVGTEANDADGSEAGSGTDTTPPPIIAQLFNADTAAVLGAQDPRDEQTGMDVIAPLDTEEDVLGTTATPTAAIASQLNFMGLAWYWWLAILAVLAGIWWRIAAQRRNASEV